MAANPTVSSIVQALMAQNSVDAEVLNTAVALCQKNGGSLLDYLLKNKHLAFQDLQAAVQNLYQLSCFNPALDSVDPEYSKVLPVAFMVTHQVCPLSFDESRKLLNVLMVDPDNLAARDQISLITGYRVRPVFGTPEQMETLLKRLSMGQNKSDDALARLEEDETLQEEMLQALSGNDIESQIANEDSPIVKLVNAILTEAYFQNASDVHIEPNRENLVIRYRVDGILREAKVLPKTYSLAFVSRVKVASGMNIAEKRVPQDGRLSLMIQGQRLDMRVNTLACQFGESVVLRLLKASATAVGLDKLGIGPEEIRRLVKMIRSPYGIILVTGPTGSGKTTTLYSALREINAQTSKIITIEDPIEYPLPSIIQTQVAPKMGLTFSSALRAILRQDPDVIMVGEIRDEETIEAAMHAALTGHLVFSTIHTNSAAQTIIRLREMGAPPFMISSSVIGVVAQRLIRKICDHCKIQYAASEEELIHLGLHKAKDAIYLHKGKGCSECNQTGYHGRIGLYEIMTVGPEVQKLIDSDASSFAIQEAALQKGMITLGMDGERKVAAGLTTVEEVTRVLGLNW